MIYATIEFADKYFKSQFGNSWASIALETKNQLLDNATLNIDSLNYRGKKLVKEQINEFPRQFPDQSFSDDNRISQACCEEALSIFENKGVNLNSDDDFSDFKLGDISIKGYSKKVSGGFKLFNSKAEMLLKPYLKSNSFKVLL